MRSRWDVFNRSLIIVEHRATEWRRGVDGSTRETRAKLREGEAPPEPLGNHASWDLPSPGCVRDARDFAQCWSYSSWRRHQMPPVSSLRPLGARSSHWYMPQRPSNPRA